MSDSILLTNKNDNLFVNGLNVIPTASVICFAGVNAPNGWLLCDGSEISRTEYSNLFSTIGDIYGSTSSSTFKLPNLNKKFPMGKSDSTNLGDKGGSSSVTLTSSNMPAHSHTGSVDSSGAHNHTITDPGHTHLWLNGLEGDDSGSGGSNYEYTRIGGNVADAIQKSTTGITINTNGSHSHTFTTDSTGSGNSIDITNPYIVLNYIIRY